MKQAKNKEDYNIIYDFAVEWVKTQFKWFSANDLKKAYQDAGNEIPTQPNLFGGVFSSLSKKSLIFHFGYTNSKTPQSKGCLIRTWISFEYKKKQKENASNKSNLTLF